MLPADNSDTAKQSALIVDDDRARHFYDPKRRVGLAVALSLGEPDMIAWDIYLFYAAGQDSFSLGGVSQSRSSDGQVVGFAGTSGKDDVSGILGIDQFRHLGSGLFHG